MTNYRYDERTSEYNTITDKLLTAQNKLAMLRSRTVRCLTKVTLRNINICSINCNKVQYYSIKFRFFYCASHKQCSL